MKEIPSLALEPIPASDIRGIVNYLIAKAFFALEPGIKMLSFIDIP